MEYIKIHTDFIKLQQALKLANVVGQGSDAKIIIQDGLVKVNGEICTMRGKKCVAGDIIAVSGELYDNGQEFVFEVK
ncbi:MAG: RNA-binding S4 domain-containing protein [Clostridia bacterium]|nr:RNA-binding S4 domain-containing protein [Clostridia bacterium]